MNEHSQTADRHRDTDGTVTVYCYCGLSFSDQGEAKARRLLAFHIADELGFIPESALAMDAPESPREIPASASTSTTGASIGEAPSLRGVARPDPASEQPAAPVPLPFRKRRDDVHAFCSEDDWAVVGTNEKVATEAATRHCFDTGHATRVEWSGSVDISQPASAITGEVASGSADV